MDEITGIIGKLSEGLTNVIGEITKLTAAIIPFVQAISPGTVQLFNQALRDWMATIGSAFIPALQIATSAIREMSGVILPLMHQLQPLFAQLANTLANVLVSQLRVWASLITALIPVLQVLLDAFAALMDVVKTIMDVFIAVIRTIGSFFGGLDTKGIADVFKQLANVLKEAIKQLVMFSANLAKFLGMNEFVGRLSDQFKKLADEEKNRPMGLKAAAQNPMIEGIESITKKFTTAAFIAQGAGANREQTDNQLLQDISKELAEISGNSESSIKRAILDAWDSIWADIKQQFPGVKNAKQAMDQVTDPSSSSKSRFQSGREAGGLAGGAIAVGAGLASDLYDALPDIF